MARATHEFAIGFIFCKFWLLLVYETKLKHWVCTVRLLLHACAILESGKEVQVSTNDMNEMVRCG